MILDEALRLHRMGWCVLPIKPRSKQPALRTWKRYQDKRPKESDLTKWFVEGTDKGLAVVLGDVSDGLVCRDFDRLDAFDAWAATHSEWASQLPQSETNRGRHVFCRSQSKTVESLSQTDSSIIDYGDGELRGGGLACLPPSIHKSGHNYRWLIPLSDSIPLVDLQETGLAQSWCEDSMIADSFQLSSGCLTEEDGRVLKTTEYTEEYRSQEREGERGIQLPVFSLVQDEIAQAIIETLPTGPGKRNRAVFKLAQRLKGIGALFDADPSHLRSIVLEWHRLAQNECTTVSPEETLADFHRAWGKVKHPAGVLRKLFDEALTDPLPHCCKPYPTYEVKQLIALCRKLSCHWLPKPFPLACRSAGELLGVSHVTANAWLSLLVIDGVLKLDELGSQKTHRASRYFYCGD